MENVLKKALDDAFTAQWAAELDNIAETEHVFAPSFELEMKRNIQKVRHPIMFYTNYIAAAAACAVIAIGAAVVIPLLSSGRIDVDDNPPPVSVTEEATTAPVETPVAVSSSSEDVLTDDGEDDHEEDDEAVDTAGEYIVTVPSTDTTSVSDNINTTEKEEDISDPSEVTTAPIKEIIEKEPDPPDFEQSDYGPGNIDNDWPDASLADKDVDDDEGDDDVAVTDDDEGADTDYDEGDVESTDSVDDGIIDIIDGDDCLVTGGDANPASGGDGGLYDSDDDSDDVSVIGSDDHVPSTEVGKKNKFPQADTLGDLFTKITPDLNKGALTVYNANITINGKGTHALYPFGGYMSDFIRGSLNAPYSASKDKNVSKCITMTVYDTAAPEGNRVMQNYSEWARYNDLYFHSGNITDEDDDDYDVDVDNDDPGVIAFSAVVSVYDNGYIFVTNAVDHKSGKTYKDVMRFKADRSAVDKLFANAEKTLLSDSVSTVGGLKDAMNIVPENIASAYMDIRGIYDTNAYSMKVSSDAVSELFRENSANIIYRSINNSGKFADCNVVLSDPSATLRLSVTSDRCIVTLYDNSSVMFALNEGSFERFISAAGKLSNMQIPIYRTLADFVEDKNFTTIERAYVRNKDTMYLAGDDEYNAIMSAVRDELPKAVYCVNKYKRYSEQYVCVNIKGWRYDRGCELRIYADDTVQISSNVFQSSSGFYKKMKKLIIESESMSSEAFALYINSALDTVDAFDAVVDDD